MKKKLIALFLCVSMLAIAVVGGTLAYFTDKDEATNVFTVGNVSIDLTEPKWDASGSKDAPEVYPGEALAKDPTVTNDGANPCFVRISVTGWDCLAPASDIIYRTNYVNGALGTDWTLHTDGYFYYTKVLASGETTDALFDQIVIPTDLTNGDGKTEFKIEVKAYAVQAQGALGLNWAGVTAMSVEQIAQWFGQAAPAEWTTPAAPQQ